MENEKANDWKKREIGALWKKTGKSQNYFSGRINTINFKNEDLINIVGFTNKGKSENPNSPDVILYLSENLKPSSLDLTEKTEDATPKEVSKNQPSFDDETPEF